MNKPCISIIIAARNAEIYIKTCLDSILEEKTGSYEIVVVDDCSDDSTNTILSSYARKKHITLYSFPVKKGAAAARNYAVAKCRGTYLFFLDSDTKIPTGWSNTVLNQYKHFPQSIVVCKLMRFHSQRFDSAGEFLSPFYLLIDRAKAAVDSGQFEKGKQVFSGKSAAMIIPKDQFKLLGGFDEKMEWLVEDTDLCFRNWIAGYDVRYQPEITVFHNDPTFEKTKQYYRNLLPKYRGCRNTIRTVLKNAEGNRLWYAVPLQSIIWLTLSFFAALRLDFRTSGEVLQGIGWNFLHLSDTLRERHSVQRMRIVSDRKLMQLVGKTEPVIHYLDKAIRYVRS